MSDYTVTTDFGAKDALLTGNPAKLIKGSEFTTEFDNIATAVATKADKASPTFTTSVTLPATITTPLTASRALALNASSQLVASATTATELGYLSGVTSALQTQLDAKLASATAASTYQTQAGMSSYLTTASAASTYAPLTNPQFTTGSVKASVTSGLWTYNYGSSAASGIVYFSQDGSRYLLNNAGTFTLSHALTVGGTVTASDFTISSDLRKKKDIVAIGGALKIVQELDGVRFTYKDTGKKSVGFIAQEVEAVLPELVSRDEEGFLSVSYGQVVAVLVEAVKELQAEIAALKGGR